MAYVPTEEDKMRVKLLAGYGVPREGIAKIIGIGISRLRENFSEELELGVTEANAKVAQNLFRMATGDDRAALTAAIFWMKTRAGWRERPQEIEVTVQNEERTDDDRARGLALLMAKRAANDNRRIG